MEGFRQRILEFHEIYERWPKSLDELREHHAGLELEDIHGRKYRYVAPSEGKKGKLQSSGKDGKFDTNDDQVMKLGQ